MKVSEARRVLNQSLRSNCTERLENLGLKVLPGRPAAKGSIGDSALLRLDLDIWRDSGGTCHVSPQVEVTIPEVLDAARILAPNAPDLDFTYVCSMASAKPYGAKSWAFSDESDPSLFLDGVLDNVEKFLLPIAESLGSINDLAAATLPLPVSPRYSDGLMIAAARFVRGDATGAIQAIELAYPSTSELDQPYREALTKLHHPS